MYWSEEVLFLSLFPRDYFNNIFDISLFNDILGIELLTSLNIIQFSEMFGEMYFFCDVLRRRFSLIPRNVTISCDFLVFQSKSH